MTDKSQPRVILSEFAWKTYGEILKGAVPGIIPKDSVPDLRGGEIGFVTRISISAVQGPSRLRPSCVTSTSCAPRPI